VLESQVRNPALPPAYAVADNGHQPPYVTKYQLSELTIRARFYGVTPLGPLTTSAAR
jgi:hypothetical protein